jgi:monovalent cation:H+ antiporter-2, CPA2 family
LAEVGEFSFVILLEGLRTKTISEHDYQLFLGVTLFSLVIIPTLWKPFERFAAWLVQRPWLQHLEHKRYATEAGPHTERLKDHVVLIGCGPFGQVVLHALHLHGERSVILDLNSQTIRHLQKAGYDALYGEASNLKMLESLHIESARALIVTIPDLQAAEAVIREARAKNPLILILARARFATEIEKLRSAGSTHVVYEEMEAATEMSRVLVQHLEEKKLKAES